MSWHVPVIVMASSNRVPTFGPSIILSAMAIFRSISCTFTSYKGGKLPYVPRPVYVRTTRHNRSRRSCESESIISASASRRSPSSASASSSALRSSSVPLAPPHGELQERLSPRSQRCASLPCLLAKRASKVGAQWDLDGRMFERDLPTANAGPSGRDTHPSSLNAKGNLPTTTNTVIRLVPSCPPVCDRLLAANGRRIDLLVIRSSDISAAFRNR
ncbi:uncharacterized protein LAESUDRAFT_71793 [Laetiporus sulphureus 93-53]|uniref:Uncharacterized protein n=1 Tax=Laetiporus sulphureus 93-53 TaxID=1314785 RepID=A0A165AW90_9APHY|nr:uncharacterized protein LAESUDRAFT_71793 [Laetiporus sulphureus 93-53]KZS99778.1 hypothetical protein LAESUDRAFT_71793 [Laetiporus sulphureus 93-53]